MTRKSRLPEEVGRVDRLPASGRRPARRTPVPPTTGGITSSAGCCTRASVCADWGEVVGYDNDHGAGVRRVELGRRGEGDAGHSGLQ